LAKAMDKNKLAMDLFIESVYKPDSELRSSAIDQECLDELLYIREDVLEYLYSIRRKQNGSIEHGA
jgi:hypothetical protein